MTNKEKYVQDLITKLNKNDNEIIIDKDEYDISKNLITLHGSKKINKIYYIKFDLNFENLDFDTEYSDGDGFLMMVNIRIVDPINFELSSNDYQYGVVLPKLKYMNEVIDEFVVNANDYLKNME